MRKINKKRHKHKSANSKSEATVSFYISKMRQMKLKNTNINKQLVTHKQQQ